jgi:hypothetical protein
MSEQQVQTAGLRAVVPRIRQIWRLAIKPFSRAFVLCAVNVEHKNAGRRAGGHTDERARMVAP